MKLLVIGAGMMGSAAAYDMAKQLEVQSVTLADNDVKRAKDVAARVNHITGDKKVRAVARLSQVARWRRAGRPSVRRQ